MRGWAGTGREGLRGVSVFCAPRCYCAAAEAACGRSVGEGRAPRAAGRAVAGAWWRVTAVCRGRGWSPPQTQPVQPGCLDLLKPSLCYSPKSAFCRFKLGCVKLLLQSNSKTVPAECASVDAYPLPPKSSTTKARIEGINLAVDSFFPRVGPSICAELDTASLEVVTSFPEVTGSIKSRQGA